MTIIDVIHGDITTLAVDAIVNAANPSLLGGAGVDGAIHRAAGPALRRECEGLGGCATGDAKRTRGYALPARFVIHTVGPVWRGGKNGERDALASCYLRCLDIASVATLGNIAFPCISTGVYGYPAEKAAECAVQTVHEFASRHVYPQKIIFCCFTQEALEYYRMLLGTRLAEPIDPTGRAP